MKRTILAFWLLSFSTAALWISCSNEDVPVTENEETEMDGASEEYIFFGGWYCTQTDNPQFFAESDKMDMYLRYAEIQSYGSFGGYYDIIETGRGYMLNDSKMGKFYITIISDTEIILTFYTSTTEYNFTFERMY